MGTQDTPAHCTADCTQSCAVERVECINMPGAPPCAKVEEICVKECSAECACLYGCVNTCLSAYDECIASADGQGNYAAFMNQGWCREQFTECEAARAPGCGAELAPQVAQDMGIPGQGGMQGGIPQGGTQGGFPNMMIGFPGMGAGNQGGM